MRVVDTSAWIEWMTDSPTGASIAKHVPAAENFIVPTMVQFELAKWVARELDEVAVDAVIAAMDSFSVVPLSQPIALYAAQFAAEFGLSAADAIIYATARTQGADLLTCDAHFRDLPDVIFVANKV